MFCGKGYDILANAIDLKNYTYNKILLREVEINLELQMNWLSGTSEDFASRKSYVFIRCYDRNCKKYSRSKTASRWEMEKSSHLLRRKHNSWG